MLVDSGCTISSINATFARTHKLPTRPITKPRRVLNADGSINGYVKKVVDVDLRIVDSEGLAHNKTIELQVINLGDSHDIFLGDDWLVRHNPDIDWSARQLDLNHCPDGCHTYDGS